MHWNKSKLFNSVPKDLTSKQTNVTFILSLIIGILIIIHSATNDLATNNLAIFNLTPLFNNAILHLLFNSYSTVLSNFSNTFFIADYKDVKALVWWKTDGRLRFSEKICSIAESLVEVVGKAILHCRPRLRHPPKPTGL